MTAARLALLAALAACKQDACDRFADLVARCAPELPRATADEAGDFCRATAADQRIGSGYRACATATTCDELSTCFTRTGCSFVLTGPDDTTPQLYCQ